MGEKTLPQGHRSCLAHCKRAGALMAWTTFKRKLFDMLAPEGLYIVQSAKPISAVIHTDDGVGVERRYGGNRGCRPVRVGTMWSLRDNISATFDKNPFVRTGVERRIWLPRATKAAAHKLAGEANHILAEAAATAGFGELLHSFIDAGPKFDAGKFEAVILQAATGMSIWPAWSHDDLSAFLDQVIEFARVKGIDAANKAALVKLLDKMVLAEAQGKAAFRRAPIKHTLRPQGNASDIPILVDFRKHRK
jgi:hypothetical protein